MNTKTLGPPFYNHPALKEEKRVKIEWQIKLIRYEAWQSCLNCADWNKKAESCDKFKGRPPATAIVNGCEEHVADIPF